MNRRYFRSPTRCQSSYSWRTKVWTSAVLVVLRQNIPTLDGIRERQAIALQHLLWGDRAKVLDRTRSQRNLAVAFPDLGAGKVEGRSGDQLVDGRFGSIERREMPGVVHRRSVQCWALRCHLAECHNSMR